VRIISRQKAIYFFLPLGVCLAGMVVAVGSGWIILNWREGIRVFLGVIFLARLSAGSSSTPLFECAKFAATSVERNVFPSVAACC
jgi:hypothetical protein